MAQLTKEQQAAIDNYSQDIVTLKDTVTAIRQVPGMYAGGRSSTGYLSLIRELYQNGIDQVVDPTSPADTVRVIYNEQTLEVEVADNGKGFPFQDMVRMVTAQHTSKNYTKKKGEYSSGLHGSGLKVVNALSTECHVISYKYDGTAMQLDLEEGYVVGKGPYSIPNKEKKQGAIVRFIPSVEVLGDIDLSWKKVYHLIRDILSLTPLGSRVYFEAIDKDGVKHTEDIINKDGINTKLIANVKAPLCAPIVIGHDNGEFKIDVAFCYDMGTSEDGIMSNEAVTAFCNMCPTIAGEHISGTLDGICRWFTQYMNNVYLANQKAKDKLKVTSADIKGGLNIMISGFCLEPTFVGQAKEQLSVPEMAPFCRDTVMKGLEEWSKSNPQDLAKLSKFFKDMAEIRQKSEGAKAKVATNYIANPLNGLPAKYKRPLKDKGVELIIVEGDSACGTVMLGRDANIQGVFPIRGKIKNAFKCSREAFFANEEVQGITRIILGKEGYHRNFSIDDCHVDRVIFMSDADVDGNHIAALLLRMFVMYFPQMISAGMIYKAIPPLYSVKQGKKNRYFIDQVDIVKFIQKSFMEKYKFEPIKGEMNTRDITNFFVKNADYIYYLTDASDTYAVNPYLMEMALFNYVENGDKFDYKKLKKNIEGRYRFITVSMINDNILISGTIEESNSLILNDRLINDCNTILGIMRHNDSFYYKIDGTPMSLYDIMKLYDKVSPTGLQRYKGLGEMPKEDLAESTLLPEERTLIQYTLEDAKEEIETIREYESDSKKILGLVGKVTRDDLLE